MSSNDTAFEGLRRHNIPADAPLQALKDRAQGLGLNLNIKRAEDGGWLANVTDVSSVPSDKGKFVPIVGNTTASSEQEAAARALNDYLTRQG